MGTGAIQAINPASAQSTHLREVRRSPMTEVPSMSRFRKAATAAVLVVAATAISLTGSVWALSGGAGAATTTTTHPPTAQACSAVHGKLPYGQRMEARFTAKADKAEAQATRAQKAGHARQAAHLERIVSHDQAVAARLGHSKYAAKQAARFAAVAKACSAP
jgi:hypothetical protein